MPDQQPPQLLSEADLSARLHHLAAQGAAPVLTMGAQVRSRAVRRRRNRRAALAATVLGAAAVTVVTTGALGSPAESSRPSAPPAASLSRTPTPTPSPAHAQRVTVDLDTYTLTVGGKTFRIGKPSENCPIGETEVTVTAKYPSIALPPDRMTKYVPVMRWVVAFTDRSHHQRMLTFALNPDAGLSAIGNEFDAGAIALSPHDGKWVYDAVRLGAHVEIKGRQGASADPDSVCLERRPITGNH
ncbi:L,D-transpeptidase [Streptomyces sp. NPDC047028]|uniref:L,D-transpeptidase n=1 Tax=Streptomyces sp. NPDC047028 TaxID=3155793 RepID=UPI0033F73D76